MQQPLVMNTRFVIKSVVCNIQNQKASIEQQIAELSEIHKVLVFKEWYYTTAKENGSTSVPRNMTLEELPEEFREIRKKLRGE